MGWIDRCGGPTRGPALKPDDYPSAESLIRQWGVVEGHVRQFLGTLHVARLYDTGVVSREEANQWWTSLAAADRDGTFLYGFTAFIVSGTKA